MRKKDIDPNIDPIEKKQFQDSLSIWIAHIVRKNYEIEKFNGKTYKLIGKKV